MTNKIKVRFVQTITGKNGKKRYYYKPHRGGPKEAEHRHLWRRLPDDWDGMTLPKIPGQGQSIGGLEREVLAQRFAYTKMRAKVKKWENNLTLEYLISLYAASGGKCQVSGIPFEFSKLGSHKDRPFSLSIDRIDSRAGYTMGNVRLVCKIVNLAMSDWGEKPLLRLIETWRFGTRKEQTLQNALQGLTDAND